MYYFVEDFEKKTPSNISVETIELACKKAINVYTIETVHDLTQFIGLGKYKNNKVGNVYFRVEQWFHHFIEKEKNLIE